MPTLLALTSAQRVRIRKAYLAGRGPADIALSLRASGLDISGRQISNLIVRERWSSQRREITEAGRVSVNEALTSAREGMGGHLSEIMSAVISDLRRDAEKLDDGGMDLATDASGVSSVQRAKRLFLERVFAVAGVDQAAPAAVTVNLSAFVARPMAAANGSAPAAEPAIEITASNADDLEFE